MDDENKEELTEEVKAEETQDETTAEPQSAPVGDFTETVKRIQDEYAKRLADTEERAKRAIAERDNLIAQLLSGEKQDAPNEGIAARLNKAREYKKW